MKHVTIFRLCLVLLTAVCVHTQLASAATTVKGSNPSLIRQVPPLSSKDWVERHVMERRPLVLSNAYLFQVMKGVAQENQKAVEEDVVIPLLSRTLHGLVAAASDKDTQRLFGVALLLLTDTSDLKLPEPVAAEAANIRNDPLFAPRGHYTDSEQLEKYFQAMQYLSKATMDVSVKPEAFPFPKEMLYPFETASKVRGLFTNPRNAKLLANWRAIHSFYDSINGGSDLPTFVDLMDRFKGQELTRQGVEDWIRRERMPKINSEMGLGVQPFGERFSIHQGVIDDVKRAMFKPDTPRQKMAEILRFRNLMTGLASDETKIQGLAASASGDRSRSYYSAVLRAIGIGGRGWQSNPFRLNFFAASLTALAEQTALMTRTSTMVLKSSPVPATVKQGTKLYFEPCSAKYLLALGESSQSIVKACNDLRQKASALRLGNPPLDSPARAFRIFATLSRRGKPLVTGRWAWRACSKYIADLPRDPAVTVDVFRFRDRSGNTFYYQWAIAPFEANYSRGRSGGSAPGMEMVFFEAWAEEFVANVQGPMNNLQWQQRLSEDKLNVLPSILRLPEQEVVQ